MRRRVSLSVLVAAAIFIAGIGGTSPGRMTVQVREGMLRTGPSFLSGPIGKLNYTDTVDVLSSRSGWFQVRTLAAAPLQGWIHGSALTTKAIVLAAGAKDADLAARSDEVALAGKGFNESVEANYRKTHRDLDFAWVDRMETFMVSQSQIQSFLKNGGVSSKGGAQ